MKKSSKILENDIQEALQDEEEEDYDSEEEVALGDGEEDGSDEVKGNSNQKLTRPPKFNVEKNNRTIFVGNLPKQMTTRTIKKLFKDCGDIESVRIRSVAPEKKKLSKKVAAITKQIHGKIASFNAYVVFKTNLDDLPMKNGLAKNGLLVDGHHIRVDRASKPKSQKHKVKVSRKKSVYVGNLPFDVKDDEVYTFFQKTGPIDNVRIIRDGITSVGKGFGFVCFKDRASVNKALELHDHRFRNRAIRVTKVLDETTLSRGGQEQQIKKVKKNRPKSAPKGLKGLIHKKQPNTTNQNRHQNKSKTLKSK